MNARTIGLFVFVLTVSLIASAGSTCANSTILSAAGSKLDFDFVAANGDNFYQFQAFAGRSYSVEVHEDYDDSNTPPLAVTVADSSSACGALTSAAGTTDTSATEPALPSNATRISVPAAAAGTYHVQVHNSDGTNGHYIRVTVADTTFFNASWTTFGGNITEWSWQNTSGQTIKGSIQAVDTQGKVIANIPALNFNIPPNTVVNKIIGPSFDVNVAANHGGFAVFTHDGPPGALTVSAFIISLVNGQIVPSPFVTVRAGQ